MKLVISFLDYFHREILFSTHGRFCAFSAKFCAKFKSKVKYKISFWEDFNINELKGQNSPTHITNSVDRSRAAGNEYSFNVRETEETVERMRVARHVSVTSPADPHVDFRLLAKDRLTNPLVIRQSKRHKDRESGRDGVFVAATAKESRDEGRPKRARYKEKETREGREGERETLIVLIPLQAPGGFKSRLSGG